MNIYNILVDMQTKLSAITDIATCKISLEKNMTPHDYPINRLVPQDLRRTDQTSWFFTVDIYYGYNLLEFEQGLDEVYRKLLNLEQTITETIRVGDNYRAKFVSTITDEDEIELYKIFRSEFEVSFCWGNV